MRPSRSELLFLVQFRQIPAKVIRLCVSFGGFNPVALPNAAEFVLFSNVHGLISGAFILVASDLAAFAFAGGLFGHGFPFNLISNILLLLRE